MRFAPLAIAAFGLLPLSTASFAADLPVAPEPIDYVRVCDSYGSRFYYIPGTETCLRVGGRVRVEYRFNNFGSAPNNWSDRSDDDLNFRGRGYLYLDSRTNTEFGLLRTYTSMYLTNTSGSESSSLEFAYIQFGGFTFGHAQSFWDFWTGYSYGAQLTDYSDVKSNVLAYTGSFGNGFSATVSLEDANSRQSNLISAGGNGYAGTKMPDLVANLRVDQGWGSAQLMGALHQVRFADASADGTLGWVIGGGVEVNVPILGQDDAFVIQVAYSDGASAFPLDTWDDQITDAINVGGSTKTTKTWNISAGWNHNFSKTLEANLEGGYHVADAGTAAYDFSQWGITGNVVWKPVPGFGIGGELQYREVDYDTASGLSDKDEIYGTLRVQRTF
ncbi:porin [Roseibium polysiphoniae]|uniref:Porin n=1 Tax=Roseibium polysiphoniae TaxID=2571221 RepID=A0A927Q5A3_9HYPH|nr:porin [Roseibium polysiphoniae]MBD8878048.1 porin [Roseibium polysiphoniae]MBS8261402.1 porin [Roseibium polysiphoniae]